MAQALVNRAFAVSRRADATLYMEMHLQLAASLNAAAGTRNALRHLAHFEKAFAARGLDAIELLATTRLRRTHAELVILMNVAPASLGLASLETRLRDTLAARSSSALAQGVARVAGEADAAVQVSEGTQGDFDQAVADSDLAGL